MTFYHLQNRCVISVSGIDAQNFLQGIISNDIRKASHDSFLYAMMLSPQGRFLYDFFITQQDDQYLLDCQSARAKEIMAKLALYKLRSQVVITPTNLGVYASDSRIDEHFFADPRQAKLGYRALRQAPPAGEMQDFISYEQKRIELLIPDADADFIYDKSFPLEFGANDLNAVDYQKGCYIGQELTARTQYRGTIRKKLYLIEATAGHLEKGQEIKAITGEKVGIVLGMLNQQGLALINVEDLALHPLLADVRIAS
jgi:hypothetical protein